MDIFKIKNEGGASISKKIENLNKRSNTAQSKWKRIFIHKGSWKAEK